LAGKVSDGSARVQEGRRCMFALRAVMCRPTNALAHAAGQVVPNLLHVVGSEDRDKLQ